MDSIGVFGVLVVDKHWSIWSLSHGRALEYLESYSWTSIGVFGVLVMDEHWSIWSLSHGRALEYLES